MQKLVNTLGDILDQLATYPNSANLMASNSEGWKLGQKYKGGTIQIVGWCIHRQVSSRSLSTSKRVATTSKHFRMQAVCKVLKPLIPLYGVKFTLKWLHTTWWRHLGAGMQMIRWKHLGHAVKLQKDVLMINFAWILLHLAVWRCSVGLRWRLKSFCLPIAESSFPAPTTRFYYIRHMVIGLDRWKLF